MRLTLKLQSKKEPKMSIEPAVLSMRLVEKIFVGKVNISIPHLKRAADNICRGEIDSISVSVFVVILAETSRLV